MIGKNVTWRRRFDLMIAPAGIVEIGDGVFFNNDCSISANHEIRIGRNCLFGEGVKIYDHNHMFSSIEVPIKSQGFSNGSVVIGENCWIASNVVILKNTSIGDNVVVGAGVVVTGKIDSNMILKNNGEGYELIKRRI